MKLDSQLAHLENADLVRQLYAEDLVFIFKHVLFQSMAYESLLKHDRPRLHLQVANAIEQLYPDRLQEFAALLGGHFALAGERDKGAAYLRLAAQRELARFAYEEASQHLEAAVNLFQSAPPCNDSILLLEEAGDAYRLRRSSTIAQPFGNMRLASNNWLCETITDYIAR